jgi:hypothetical protein
MTLSIPSTTLRAKYIRTLPINSVYKDPKNDQNYIVVERKLNNSFLKQQSRILNIKSKQWFLKIFLKI